MSGLLAPRGELAWSQLWWHGGLGVVAVVAGLMVV
jgi:hypothetical protein